MNKNVRSLFVFAALLLSSFRTGAQTVVMGITEDNKLFRIANAAAPATINTPTPITGLASGQTVAGADYRPNTGELFLLGYNSSTGASQLYTLNTTTGAATAVGTAQTLPLGSGSIGFDFNPAVDRIRVVAANGANYRLHPVTGAIAGTDVALNYNSGDPNNGMTPSVGAAAYINSYPGSEATVLYDYDESLNILATQNPPNNGTLNTIGSSGITVNSSNRSTDMDIFFDAVSGNVAYLAANTGVSNNDNLYTVNLNTGSATLIGMIGSGVAVKDIAVVIDRSVPPLSGQLIYGLTRTNRNLFSFDSNNPQLIRSIMAVTGIDPDYVLAGMDFRPATRQLYGMAYKASSQEYKLYTIDPATAAATVVNATPGTLPLGSGHIGFDFNPVVDRIRVVSTNGANYRLNPTDGSIAGTDITLTYAAGDVNNGKTPRVGTVAYTNSYPAAPTTILFAIDDTLGALLNINPPNNGTLNTLVNGAYTPNNTDLSSDLDFFYDSTSATNTGYLAVNSAPGNNDSLYAISATGLITTRNRIGYGIPVTDIAVPVLFTNSPVGIAGIGAGGEFLLYPNPAGDLVSLDLGRLSGTDAQVTLYAMSGQELAVYHSGGKKSMNISLASFPPGHYLLQISAHGSIAGWARVIRR